VAALCLLLSCVSCGSGPHRLPTAADTHPVPTPTRTLAVTVAPTAPPVVGVPATATATATTQRPLAPLTTGQRVAAAVRAAVGTRETAVDVAVADLTSGESAHVGRGTPVRGASLIKLLIYLSRARRPPMGDHDAALAQAMIERSDNDAATALWRAGGEDAGVSAVVRATGMSRTTRVPALLEPWDGWVTTASDQLRLLRQIRAGRGAGTVRLRELMSQVEADQSWGAGRVPGVTGPFVKNGWLPVSGAWVVSTDGCMTTANGHAVCVAVTSAGSPTMRAGVATVQAAATAAVRSIARS
jgi:hypothetical protein